MPMLLDNSFMSVSPLTYEKIYTPQNDKVMQRSKFELSVAMTYLTVMTQQIVGTYDVIYCIIMLSYWSVLIVLEYLFQNWDRRMAATVMIMDKIQISYKIIQPMHN